MDDAVWVVEGKRLASRILWLVRGNRRLVGWIKGLKEWLRVVDCLRVLVHGSILQMGVGLSKMVQIGHPRSDDDSAMVTQHQWKSDGFGDGDAHMPLWARRARSGPHTSLAHWTCSLP
ncbi:hypothetical protein ACLB2K_014608 [Fragaria x ananassa]